MLWVGFYFRCAVLAGICLAACGCRTVGKHSPSPEAVANGRQLSQQGISAMETGRWQEAESLLRQAVEATPTDPDSRRYFAESLWQLGASSEAIGHIEAAHALAPTDPALAVRAGEMLLAIGDHQRALERAELAIERDPKLPEAWALRGRVWWRKQQHERALADLQRALQFSPSAPDLLIDLANLYYQRGEPQRCLTTVHRLLDLHGAGEEPLEAVVLEGRAYLAMGLAQPASERFAQVKSRSPPSPDLYCLIAQAELGAGRPQTALAAAQDALALNASHAPSQELLTRLTAAADTTHR